jgi:hypothetical protein
MYDEYFLHKIIADFNLSFCRRSFAEFVTEILDVNDTEYNIFLREGHRIFFKVMCPRDCPVRLDWLKSDSVGQAMTTKAFYASFQILNLTFNLLLKSQGFNAKITLMAKFLEQRFDLCMQDSQQEQFFYTL